MAVLIPKGSKGVVVSDRFGNKSIKIVPKNTPVQTAPSKTSSTSSSSRKPRRSYSAAETKAQYKDLSKMTPAEAITAATYNAACAINRQHLIGSIEQGKQADLLVLSIPNHHMLPYHFGINHVETVIKNGTIIT